MIDLNSPEFYTIAFVVAMAIVAFMLGHREKQPPSINLVITIQEEKCTIVEKKGVKRRRCVGEPVTGEATLKCLRPGNKYRIRYESQLTSAWANFTLDTTRPVPVTVALRY